MSTMSWVAKKGKKGKDKKNERLQSSNGLDYPSKLESQIRTFGCQAIQSENNN